MNVRNYKPTDYEQVKSLYSNNSTFGGQFDAARDSEKRLRAKIEMDPSAILVAEDEGRIIGTVSIIDDGRVAWLFRFAVVNEQANVTQALHERAIEILKSRGHKQVLVYAPSDDHKFAVRYKKLGFAHGGSYTCYWKDIA